MKSFYITHFSRHEQYNICLNYFGQIAGSTMLDHMESVCLVLYETTKLSFKMVEQLCFSMSNEGEFLLFCILPSLVFSLFWNDHSSRCVVAKHYCFNLHFPDDICEALFVICMSSLVACLFRSLAHFKNQVACFLIVEFYKLFIYSG